MAGESGGPDVVVSSILCFIATKFGKFDLNRLKTVVKGFYQPHEITLAKRQLTEAAEVKNLTDLIPRNQNRREGEDKTDKEVDDIMKIFTALDEKRKLSVLPSFVTDNTESVPTTNLTDGDMTYILARLDRMEVIIDDLHKAVYSLMTAMTRTNNSQPTYPGSSTTPSQVGATYQQTGGVQSVAYMCSEQAIDLHFPHLGKPAVSKNSVQSTAQQQQSATTPSWAVISESRENREYTSTESHESQDELDGYTRATKRRRPRSNQQQAATGCGVSGVGATVITSYASVAQKETKPKPKPPLRGQERPAGDKKTESRSRSSRNGPLFVGRRLADGNANANNIQGARPKKQVFCIDNVNLSVTADDLATFVTDLGVRVISCFKVDARMSNYQRKRYKEADHKTFRLCINKADRDLLLNPDAWPADIIVSTWVFKPRPDIEAGSEPQQSTESVARDGDGNTNAAANSSFEADAITAAAAALEYTRLNAGLSGLTGATSAASVHGIDATLHGSDSFNTSDDDITDTTVVELNSTVIVVDLPSSPVAAGTPIAKSN